MAREVRSIVNLMFPEFDFSAFDNALYDVDRLFSGQMLGFEPCDTRYHDWAHTMGVLLATARLLHGVHIDRQKLSERIVNLTLIAALFHDVGYIRRFDENNGTGGQFTKDHVQRGIDLLEEYADNLNWPMEDFLDMECIILCTDPARNPETIVFMNIEAMLAAHILATADIISQMADDIYLEKLPLLFEEFTESGITDFISEYDMFTKTIGFYTFMLTKMEGGLSSVITYMSVHFRERYGIEQNFYAEAAQRNIEYLDFILEEYGEEYHNGLRRSIDRDEYPITIAA